MQLLTAEIREKLPALNSQENTDDPIAQVKFFLPHSNWTWYATEFDGQDLFFGLVQGLEEELGYFSLSELKSVNFHGLEVECDLHFTPTPLSQLRQR